MVLDIDQFRPEKGGNPEKIRKEQPIVLNSVVDLDPFYFSGSGAAKISNKSWEISIKKTHQNYKKVIFKKTEGGGKMEDFYLPRLVLDDPTAKSFPKAVEEISRIWMRIKMTRKQC